MTQQVSTFGEELKRERELRQISLREVAEATKINLRYLEALEGNDFEHLPGGVFNRGFVRAYAQFIGVDPDAMVNAYLLEDRTRNGQAEPGQGTVLRGYRSIVEAQQAAERETPSRGKWWIAAIVAVLLLAGGAWLYFQWKGRGESGEPTASPATSRPAGGEHRSAREPAAAEPPPATTAETTPSPEPTAIEPPPEPELSDDSPATIEPEAATAAPAREHSPTAPPRATVTSGATVFVDRAVSGRLNCDNRQIEVLDGMRPGARLRLDCTSYLIVDASDAGALRISLPGRATVSLGPDGQRLSNHRIDMARGDDEATP